MSKHEAGHLTSVLDRDKGCEIYTGLYEQSLESELQEISDI